MREDIFIPVHRTKVLPLRWLANYIFHPVSMWFFHIGLRATDKFDQNEQFNIRWNAYKEYIGWQGYHLLDKPYSKWGTIYKFVDGYLDSFNSSGWDDYDANGFPYWDFDWHTDDPLDDWRLINKEEEK